MMIDKRLNNEALVSKRRLVKTVTLTLFNGMLIIGQAYIIATIINLAFLQKEGVISLIPLFVFLMLLFIMRGIVQYVYNAANIKFASKMKQKIRRRLLGKYSNSSTSHVANYKAGEQVSLFTSGVDEIESYYSSYLPQLIQAAIIPLMVLIVVFTKNIYSGLIMLITAPLIPVFMALIGNMAEKKTQEQMNSLLRFSGHFLDTLKGITTLKIFGRSKQQRDHVKAMSDQFRDTTMSVLKVAFVSALMLEILATISTAMIAVEIGLRLVYGQLTFHTALFILLVAPELYLPLKNLGSSFHSGKNSMSAAEKVWEVLDKEDNQPKWGDITLSNEQPPKLVLDNVYYQSETGREILSNTNLEIQPKERIAIVGASGSGKTTLLKLMLGLLPPTSGSVSVNGLSLSSISEESWFSQVTYVDQAPHLFSGTIKDNIAISKPDATEDEIIWAAKQAGVDQFVHEFRNGYETTVGEGGRGLSGGEKQRISLARAFLKQASIVLLDEPTAGLDLETETILLKAMDGFSKRGTVIMVAHRLQTITNADKIYLLSNGRITASGNHTQLMKTSESYQQLMAAYRGGAIHGTD